MFGSVEIIGALVGLISLIGGALALFFKGKKDARNEQAVKEINEYVETRKRVENVKVDTSGSDAELLERLRQHRARK